MICGAAAKRRAHLVVGDQVEVALAVARLDVGEAVPLLRQRPQRLGEHAELLRVDGQLVGLGAERRADDADEVAEVGLLEAREGVLADRVALHVDLQPAVAIVQMEKRGLAEVALGDDAPGEAHRSAGAPASCSARQIAELRGDLGAWCGSGGNRSA